VARLPDMRACPRCGLSIQTGRNPDKLAFHECRPRAKVHERIRLLLESEAPLTEEQVKDAVFRTLLSTAAEDSSPTTLLELLRTLDRRPGAGPLTGGRGKRGPSEALTGWAALRALDEEG
jgi:hypothetical protein